MTRRAAPHRGTDFHYGDAEPAADGPDASDVVPEDAAEDATEGGPPRVYFEKPSKTRAKQQSHAMQGLGEALAELSMERLKATDMPELLLDAILQYRKTRTHEGRRRQMQYVGKLMRSADEAVLREAVASATVGSARDTLLLHEAERWRAELIADDAALDRWLLLHPETDTQQLRSLVRAARRDAASLASEARQPRSFRELFQFLKPSITVDV